MRPDGTQAFAVGLVSAGVARDDSKTTLPVPGTSLTSKLAQMLPSVVSETLTINEVRRDVSRTSQRGTRAAIWIAFWLAFLVGHFGCPFCLSILSVLVILVPGELISYAT